MARCTAQDWLVDDDGTPHQLLDIGGQEMWATWLATSRGVLELAFGGARRVAAASANPKFSFSRRALQTAGMVGVAVWTLCGPYEPQVVAVASLEEPFPPALLQWGSRRSCCALMATQWTQCSCFSMQQTACGRSGRASALARQWRSQQAACFLAAFCSACCHWRWRVLRTSRASVHHCRAAAVHGRASSWFHHSNVGPAHLCAGVRQCCQS